MADTQARQPLSRILLKISGEALLGARGLRHRSRDTEAHRLRNPGSDDSRHPGRSGHRRRQHLPRRGPRARRHGPGHRRPHGHAGDRDERPRAAGRPRVPRQLRAGHVRGPGPGSLRGLHPPPRRAPPGEGALRDLRGRHRQPVLHHRHGGLAARDRDRRRPAAEGDQGQRHLRRRPGPQSEGQALPDAVVRQGPGRPAGRDGCDGHRHVPRQRGCRCGCST